MNNHNHGEGLEEPRVCEERPFLCASGFGKLCIYILHEVYVAEETKQKA